jgi:hypothetical protein
MTLGVVETYRNLGIGGICTTKDFYFEMPAEICLAL